MLLDIIKSKTKDLADKAKTQLDGISVSADDIKRWADKAPETIHQYASRFDTDEMWQKIEKWGMKAGQDLVIMVLAMYYTIRKFIPAINERLAKK